ncbi:MAG: glycosyltransferase [Rhodospirillaceae bacterium]|nr:glycosyltransferase [Rhodospirillaceae bacterium]
MSLDIVILGLTITSSWGNGHATTYRALARALAARGHRVTFLERDMPWYRDNRDLPDPPYCRVELYAGLDEVTRFEGRVAAADLVILGSFVPDGATLGDWVSMTAGGVTAFYDIDTPVTLRRLEQAETDYISPALVPRFDLYLSFAGGPALDIIERRFGSPRARALYCGVDPALHRPAAARPRWALGYLGTYSGDRQPALERLLFEPARRLPGERFVVAGAQYPDDLAWPANVEHLVHLPPRRHAGFYCAQRWTLNITRSDMAGLGYAPSVRLFEAAACGVPIVSDRWPGIELFFTPDEEILLADDAADVLDLLRGIDDARRRRIGAAGRRRVLRSHSADRRAAELEAYYREVRAPRRRHAGARVPA